MLNTVQKHIVLLSFTGIKKAFLFGKAFYFLVVNPIELNYPQDIQQRKRIRLSTEISVRISPQMLLTRQSIEKPTGRVRLSWRNNQWRLLLRVGMSYRQISTTTGS
jgi:hypothetical protein